MDWIVGMQKAIDYVEDHLTEEIRYEDVAGECYSSVYHFQRVFGILSGYTLGEYIRNRRLSLAGVELASTDAKVIDVALKYGYDSPDSFAKAFKKFHGILPSHARSGRNKLRSFSRLVLKFSLEGGKIMQYVIKEKPEMILTGYKRRFSGVPGERYKQEEDFYLHTRPLQYLLNGMSDHPETHYDVVTNVEDDGFDFWFTQPLTKYQRENIHKDFILGDPYANEFENIVIPARTYAIFETKRCAYPTEVFLNLREQIATGWLPALDFRIAEAPELVVVHWYGPEKREKRYFELWIPIEKAE